MTRHAILRGLPPDPNPNFLSAIRPIPAYDWHLTQDLDGGFSSNSAYLSRSFKFTFSIPLVNTQSLFNFCEGELEGISKNFL
jgi:hypothetical protein